MHEYYRKNKSKLKKTMKRYLAHIAPELEEAGRKPYSALFEEIWSYYEKNLLEYFPYIGGDDVSGTSNLTGAYCFVAMGEVLKGYGVKPHDAGHLMAVCYERYFRAMPGIVRVLIKKVLGNPKIAVKIYTKKDAKNAANAAKFPGSFETKTQIPPEPGYDFSYHNLVCPLSLFAKEHGYEEYMPYLCNLDYVMLGFFGLPLYREHTCFADGDYCDFKINLGAPLLKAWPPVFLQGRGYK